MKKSTYEELLESFRNIEKENMACKQALNRLRDFEEKFKSFLQTSQRSSVELKRRKEKYHR